MSSKETKKELDADLQLLMDKNNSFMVRIELLLIQILRILKKKP
jgi:hypothetical protein